MKYTVEKTARFKKHLRQAIKQGRSTEEFSIVLSLLADDIPLPPKYRDHELTGDKLHIRECHIQPDWLLLYVKRNKTLVLTLTDIGTHSDLFG